MKAITTLLTAGLFATSAYAGSGTSDIYGGFAKGNPELSRWQPSVGEEMAGVATPYTASGSLDIYGGFAKGDPDLYQWQPSADEGMAGVQPAVGDAPYALGGSRDSALFKSGSGGTSEANRVDAYGGFAGPDLPSSF
jgi:hypothetical protein